MSRAILAEELGRTVPWVLAFLLAIFLLGDGPPGAAIPTSHDIQEHAAATPAATMLEPKQ